MPGIDLLQESLRRQSILSHLLRSEEEAMVRIVLKDPLVLPPSVAVPPGEGDGAPTAPATELGVIGPIAVSRTDSLASIEQKIPVS